MPVTTDVRAYWACESTADATGNGHTATFINTVSEVAAKVANGWQTVNSNLAWAQVADSAQLSPVGQVFYIWGWIKMGNLTHSQVLIDKGQVTAGGQEYGVSFVTAPTPRFELYVSNTGNGSISSTVRANNFGAPSANTFYFLEAWWDGSLIYIAVNRGTADSGSWTFPIFDGTAALTLCRSVAASQTVTVDEVGIRIGSLPTDDERDCLYNSGQGGTYPDFCGISYSWLGYLERVSNGADLSVQTYGNPTLFVLSDPTTNYQYVLLQPAFDTDGVGPGEQVYFKIRRLGSDPSNTSSGRQTLVNAGLRIPVKGGG